MIPLKVAVGETLTREMVPCYWVSNTLIRGAYNK